MVDNNGIRQLAYVARVSEIKPIEGKDRVECAMIGGWSVMVHKSEFVAGDLGIYFEIDSRLPIKSEFEFLASKNYKIKIQKYKTPSGHFFSEGLLMAPADLGWESYTDGDGTQYIYDPINKKSYKEGDFLTEVLGVTYADATDQKRKGGDTVDKYTKMAQRMGKKFSKQPFCWLMKRTWGKKLLYLFFGHNIIDKKYSWPSHIAAKTDVERIQNMISILQDKKPFVATEKIDGSSCSVMCERLFLGRIKQYICSRNVVFKTSSQKCFYETNIYYEVYQKYNLGEKIVQILTDYNLPNLAIQMEIYGDKIQKRDYSTKEHKIAVFHMVSNNIKFPMEKTVEICEKYNIPHVPLLDTNYILPDTLEELQAFVEKEGSQIDGLSKEGVVFYDKATGQQYFKFVSPEYLIKYHG